MPASPQKNLTSGPIFRSLLIFSLPMIIVQLVQMLFHAADIAILGFMADDAAVAAVGACGSLISLMLCLFSGYSSAATVVVAKRVGETDEESSRRAAGTAVVMGFVSGVILMTIALLFARKFLILTNCQQDILDQATLYMRIYFIGMPITMLYNFITAILRAAGDSVRPMIYMMVSGVLNIILNIVFVGALHLTVAGVAIATVLSNAAALTLAIIALARNKGYCKIELKNLRLRKEESFEIIKLGIPACISGVSFYLGEVIVTSAVNSISTDAMTANAVASQLDRIVYTIGSSIATATGVMISQNFGAKQFDRIRKTIKTSVAYVIAVTVFLGVLVSVFADVFLALMADADAVITLAKERVYILGLTNFVTCTMEVFANAVRGLKRPKVMMVVGIVCGLLIRSLWPLLVWPLHPTLWFLFVCFPLSTLIGIGLYGCVYRDAMKKLRAEKPVSLQTAQTA